MIHEPDEVEPGRVEVPEFIDDLSIPWPHQGVTLSTMGGEPRLGLKQLLEVRKELADNEDYHVQTCRQRRRVHETLDAYCFTSRRWAEHLFLEGMACWDSQNCEGCYWLRGHVEQFSEDVAAYALWTQLHDPEYDRGRITEVFQYLATLYGFIGVSEAPDDPLEALDADTRASCEGSASPKIVYYKGTDANEHCFDDKGNLISALPVRVICGDCHILGPVVHSFVTHGFAATVLDHNLLLVETREAALRIAEVEV
jgi:hypothetical protein